MFVLVLTLPTLIVLTPPASAQGACVASITLVSTTPLYASRGGTTSLIIRVNDTSGAPRVPGLPPPKATLTVSGTYSDGSTKLFDADTVIRFTPNPSDTQSLVIEIPATAPVGKAKIDLTESGGAAGDCTWGDASATYRWGFWVDTRPDLAVSDITLVRHDSTAANPNSDAHTCQPNNINACSSPALQDAELFTRYADVVASNGAIVCNEQRTGTNNDALPPRYSHAHFNIVLVNNGAADFATPTDDNTPGALDGSRALNVTLRVLDNGVEVDTQRVQLYKAMKGGSSGDDAKSNVTFPAVWSLVDRAGARNITVVIDPNNEYPEVSKANNQGSKTFTIAAPQLTATFVNVGLTAEHRFKGSIVLKNEGTKTAGVVDQNNPDKDYPICFSRTGTDFTGRVYLDTIDTSHVVPMSTGDGNITATLAPGKSTNNIGFSAQGPTVSAGKHTLIVMANDRLHADNVSDTFFLTELNFTAPHPFLNDACCNLNDTLVPLLQNVTVCIASGCTPPLNGNVGGFINISGNVVDDSDFTATSDHVFLDLTYPDTTVHSFEVPHGTPANSGGLLVNTAGSVVDVGWWFNSTYDQEGTYTLKVRAVDSANHTGAFPSVGALGFALSSFPKTMQMYQFQVCHEATSAPNTVSNLQDCVSPDVNTTEPAGRNFTRDNNNTALDGFKLTFRVPPGATGLQNEMHNATRMSLQVTDPDGITLGNYSVRPICYYAAGVGPGGSPGPDECPAGNTGVNETCGGTNVICWNSYYRIIFSPNLQLEDRGSVHLPTCTYPFNQTRSVSLFEPSLWNMTLWVGDAGCKYRKWDLNNLPGYVDSNGNATSGLAPMDFWLFDTQPGTIANGTQAGGSGTSVPAKSDLVFRADLYDDIQVKQGFAQLFRSNGLGEDLVLQQNMSAISFWNQTTRNGTYSVSIPTGFGAKVCDAGTYHWRIGLKDANHTLNFTDGSVTITDTINPTVDNEVTTHGGGLNAADTAFQLLENVTIRANATDNSCFTLASVVQDATGNELFRKPMALVPGTSSVYRSANITTGPGGDIPQEGSFKFFVEALDSVGNRFTTGVHAFLVAGDLPPIITGIVPSGGFGKPDQVVSFDVSDLVQGVNVGNISARVSVNDGAFAPVSAADLTTQVTGGTPALATIVHVSFPATANAGDKVTVNLSAEDNGGKLRLQQFSYVVDATPPVSVLSCTQSYPKPCGSEGTQAVGKSAVFTLNATDADAAGKPVAGVASLTYAVEVLGQLQPAVTVTGGSATFSLFDLVGGTDGYYVLHYSALDVAGNQEVEHRLTFALDTHGPAVQNAVTTPVPQGVNVTVSISDPLPNDVQSATLFYRNGQAPFASTQLRRIEGSNFWFGVLPGAQRGVQVCYYLSATDFLGNTATNGTEVSPICFSSENHAPSLDVLSPQDGSQVQGSFEVRWRVSDIDNDPVTVSISYRLKSAVELIGVTLSPEEQGGRSRVINATDLVSGEYLLRVEASDNQAFNNRTRVDLSFTVGNGTLLSRPTFPTEVAPGQAIKVTVLVGKAVDSIEARLLKDGQVAARQAMEQDPPGTRTYTATFHVNDPGNYEVEVRGTFSDGTPFVVRGASPIRVQGAGFNLSSPETLLILVVGVAVIALAATGLRRRMM